MKHETACLLTELTSEYATFSDPAPPFEDYALRVESWIKLDRPVRIRVTVEKL